MIVIDIVPASRDRVMVAVKEKLAYFSTYLACLTIDAKWFHRALQQRAKQMKPVDFEPARLIDFRVVGMIVSYVRT